VIHLEIGLFSLAPHVHVAATGDGAVLLDLKRDRYIGLGKRDAELLAAVIASWPRPRWDPTELDVSSSGVVAYTEELCKSMAADGLLIPGMSDDAEVHGESLMDMRRPWISVGDELEVECGITMRHTANFVAAFLWARFSLAWRPFAATVEATRTARTRGGKAIEADATRLHEMAALVGVFRQLRPWVFAADGRCLLHALTLVRFLSRYGFHPKWVIGVATQPWAAHAWVQWGDFLLDTNPEKVCRYTPILVI
jgi:hypothetical protein